LEGENKGKEGKGQVRMDGQKEIKRKEGRENGKGRKEKGGRC